MGLANQPGYKKSVPVVGKQIVNSNISTLSISYLVHMFFISRDGVVLIRQGRGSEATEDIFCLQAKKTLPRGSYEHRVPKKIQ